VLKGAVVLAALPLAGFTSHRRLSPVPADPFTLGVASGEPAPDGMVIWTRLAPRPLADDGLGGMPARAVDVEWEVATDERFTRIEQRGITTAAPEAAHSVHVELTGLRPDAEYFYRFRADWLMTIPISLCTLAITNTSTPQRRQATAGAITSDPKQ
jgi:alkaline phosphatase D